MHKSEAFGFWPVDGRCRSRRFSLLPILNRLGSTRKPSDHRAYWEPKFGKFLVPYYDVRPASAAGCAAGVLRKPSTAAGWLLPEPSRPGACCPGERVGRCSKTVNRNDCGAIRLGSHLAGSLATAPEPPHLYLCASHPAPGMRYWPRHEGRRRVQPIRPHHSYLFGGQHAPEEPSPHEPRCCKQSGPVRDKKTVGTSPGTFSVHE